MKLASASLAACLAVLPTAWSLPNNLSIHQFKLPTCAAASCLKSTNGLFDGCPPSDLACLCRLEQTEIARYVSTVQTCIDGDEGKAACTEGARYQYKSVLKTVCANEQFGNKTVNFAQVTPPA
ncbi:hypothetical protein LEMA_P030110.1 [Plenodomus lingam JN3]|uniref:CFEM domain-containing protein n=1 Tax=Leptosphaeria maculans (strain JN3 / isolate v23.1.3 / race Av1-4-5-6-7-8) TaxID=985895 RepID=E4ZW83_LEPMJ|nr:hypothetical protein LEMA_P030110.1 [Plenodomus lingam JN3]CBX95859.1 hypothetical protein LEMA_P030110.1 [Plenodomus lingam JN3]